MPSSICQGNDFKKETSIYIVEFAQIIQILKVTNSKGDVMRILIMKIIGVLLVTLFLFNLIQNTAEAEVMVYDANEQYLGILMDHGLSAIKVLVETPGLLVQISTSSGSLISLYGAPLYFTSANCTGTPYMSSVATYVGINNHGTVYIGEKVAPYDVSTNSYMSPTEGTCVTSSENLKLVQAQELSLPLNLPAALPFRFVPQGQSQAGTMLHTFTPGTVARASQVNENFNYVNYGNLVAKDGNEQEIGTVAGINYGSPIYAILGSEGYIIHLNGVNGYISSTWLYHTTSDCTGTPYTVWGNGMVIRHPKTGDLYFSEKTIPAQNITAQSIMSGDGTCSSHTSSVTVFALTANDPNITGVNSSSFTLPITIERR